MGVDLVLNEHRFYYLPGTKGDAREVYLCGDCGLSLTMPTCLHRKAPATARVQPVRETFDLVIHLLGGVTAASEVPRPKKRGSRR